MVTVVVPTKNSAATLHRCLQSIVEQQYPSLELIVVDNGSVDSTKEIARAYTGKVFDCGPERSAQRNLGARKATGSFLLFIDSDMVVSSLVIKSCIEAIRMKPFLQGLVVPEESYGNGFWAQCKKLERSFYVGISWMEAARFFTTQAFWEVEGYDETTTGGEDYDLPQRIASRFGGESLGRVGEYIFHNEGNLSLLKTCKKKFYYAQGLLKYRLMEENKNNFMRQSSIWKRYRLFFSNPKKLFRKPLIGIGMLVMKTCEFASGYAGYVVATQKKGISSKL